MDLSRKWLNEFIDLPIEEVDDRSFAEAMSVSGSKVEVTRDLSATIRNVVVGRITALEKHPDSDHMLVAQLDVGEKTVQICTGAWNVHEGEHVPVALDGALLPNGAEIRSGKLRGVVSEGMLCSLRELGMTAHDFPEAVIIPAAILGDYHPLDPNRPSISPDIRPGEKIFGKVAAAEIRSIEKENSAWRCRLSLGEEEKEVLTHCSNLHVGDLAAFDTDREYICTLEDLVEEIFGDIEDEHDQQQYTAKKLPTGEYELSARLEVEKANELLDLDLPESDDYLTVGGLILHRIQRFPKLNEVVSFDQFEFKILKNTSTKIELVRLRIREE